MRDYAIAMWGTWSQDRTRLGIEKHILEGQTEIIELDGAPIGIKVVERASDHIKVNPAQRLYQRLGFRVVDTTAEHFYMEYAI